MARRSFKPVVVALEARRLCSADGDLPIPLPSPADIAGDPPEPAPAPVPTEPDVDAAALQAAQDATRDLLLGAPKDPGPIPAPGPIAPAATPAASGADPLAAALAEANRVLDQQRTDQDNYDRAIGQAADGLADKPAPYIPRPAPGGFILGPSQDEIDDLMDQLEPPGSANNPFPGQPVGFDPWAGLDDVWGPTAPTPPPPGSYPVPLPLPLGPDGLPSQQGMPPFPMAPLDYPVPLDGPGM